MKHYHGINGQPGCMPDSNNVYATKEDAIEGLASLLETEDVEGKNPLKGMKTNLRVYGIHYFGKYASQVGAGYCQVVRCHEDCKEED